MLAQKTSLAGATLAIPRDVLQTKTQHKRKPQNTQTPQIWLLASVSLHLHIPDHIWKLNHSGVIQAGLHAHVEAPVVVTVAGSPALPQQLTWDRVCRSGSKFPSSYTSFE